ncbi:MAG TPA: hypothetical protein VJ802_05910 [Gemmatimonadaceae bacterium]|nr:hypothetical protein [Gemmatimonadaceae bacterium]
MGRIVGGIVLGIVIAVALVFAIEWVIGLIVPAPADFNMRDPEQVRARVASMPMWAMLLVLGGWVVGTGLGSWAAVRIARTTRLWPGLVVGVIVFLSTLYNVMTIPHPMWFVAIALPAIPIASRIGARSGRTNATVSVAG